GAPNMQPGGSRFTPPSPSAGARSPQIKPMQYSPQGHGTQAHPSVPQQQQQQQQQSVMRPSMSHPHLSLQPGVRPAPGHGSPVQAHQPVTVRPPGPIVQQQSRPRPPQAIPQGQAPLQHASPGTSVQLEMPTLSPSEPNGGQQQQRPQQVQQRPSGARPILDQMRQQAPPNHPAHLQSHGQPQTPQNLTPTQRQPQRPAPPHHGQPSQQQQQQQLSSPQPHPSEPSGSKDHAPNPSVYQARTEKEHQPVADQRVSNGERLRQQKLSPQQQHALPPNPQHFPGHGAGQQQHHGQAGNALQPPSPRPNFVPTSPGQKPLGAAEIKVLGPTPGVPPRSPVQHQQQQQPPQPFRSPEPEVFPLVEPDEPLFDIDDDGFKDDDIEGGSKPVVPPSAPSKAPTTQPVIDQSPPTAAGGPPTGPPRGLPRQLSNSMGSGPARIAQPSNNPSSPPASAFPPAGSLKPRVRPPPGNKVFTPYVPPERPSQAPVMYSQTGQPTLSQPFSQRGDESSVGHSSVATSMVPQGANAASSSVRPREAGLQKRLVAGEINASKAGSPPSANAMSPPSPKLHGQKGPAILSASGQKPFPSAAKTLKTWAIRGGLIYFGYTAVFNCGQDAAGVRGLYCKATNGISGLAKPLFAPYYNTYLGTHVDRYVKPVARQSHRIYLKVADPVVQGAASAAGRVYDATAKKHVDNAKDRVISILPYPFKPESSKGAKQALKNEQEMPQNEVPEVDRISRQPVHVSEQVVSLDGQNQFTENLESTIDTVKEDVGDRLEKIVQAVREDIADVKEAVLEHVAPIVEAVQHQAEKIVELATETNEQEQKESEGSQTEQHQGLETNGRDSDDYSHNEKRPLDEDIINRIATFKDSMKNVHEDVSERNENSEDRKIVQPDETKPEEPTHVEPAEEPIPEPVASTETQADPSLASEGEHISVTQPEVTSESPAEPSSSTVESTPEFMDRPTEASEQDEQAPTTNEVPVEPVEVVAEEKPIVEATAAPTEEEHREQIPVPTSQTSAPEEEQSSRHSQPKERDDHSVEKINAEEDRSSNMNKEGEHMEVVGEVNQGGAESVSEKEAEGDATLEQQAAPSSKAEHQNGSNAHDEL
ncbi:hypothetical protein BGZ54_001606, partial [Gamsiella multidivaricata]